MSRSSRARLYAVLAVLLTGVLAPAAGAADPRMPIDPKVQVQAVCFTAQPAGDPAPSQIYGRRFTRGTPSPSTPVIVLVHGVASSTETWDFSPSWSVARALAGMGYVVIAYDRLGYARSVYEQPRGGLGLTSSVQREVLHQLIGQVKSGTYSTTTERDCTGAKQPSTLRNRTAVIVGHSAGGWIVAGYPGRYHDVAAMIQMSITATTAPDEGTDDVPPSQGGGFDPNPAHPGYFTFFQERSECEAFNLYKPNIVTYAADVACTPPFLDSPYGEIAGLPQTLLENDVYVSQIGPGVPVLLSSGDRDTTAPPADARGDFRYYRDNCGCDVSQYIIPDTAHLYMVHRSLASWLDYVRTWLADRGLPPVK